jgi:hypothetical protein
MNNIKRRLRGLLVSLLVSATIAGCKLGSTQNLYAGMNTPSVTMSSAATQTPTETATPERLVWKCIKMYRKYEYLLAHSYEFIHAPDPINNRAAFDNGVSEELMDVIGPKK